MSQQDLRVHKATKVTKEIKVIKDLKEIKVIRVTKEIRADKAHRDRKVIKEMELIQLEYRCGACRATLMEWADRCSSCGEWNTVEVNFHEEISLEELGLAPAPIYTARSDD